MNTRACHCDIDVSLDRLMRKSIIVINACTRVCALSSNCSSRSHYSPRCPSPCRILRHRESSAPCSWPTILYHPSAAYRHRRPRLTRTPATIYLYYYYCSPVSNSSRKPAIFDQWNSKFHSSKGKIFHR
jgi:hypothetical protein